MYKWLFMPAMLITPSWALAHSGHGHIPASSQWHWLGEAEHMGWILPLVIGLLAFKLLRRRSK